jgi:hypothetical protein
MSAQNTPPPPCGKFYNMRFDIDDWFTDFFYVSDTINAPPNTLVKNDALKGPLCWGTDQLSVSQQAAVFTNRYFIGVVNIPYPETFFYKDNGRPFVYTCRSYGQ